MIITFSILNGPGFHISIWKDYEIFEIRYTEAHFLYHFRNDWL